VGSLREIATGQVRVLEPEHIVGRAPPPGCSQTLQPPYVSALHAALRWTGQEWELKDLNSRNGTYLDGQRIQPAGPLKLKKGSRIGFGTRKGEWEIVDADPPSVMAVPLDGGDPVRLEGDMIALPSSDDPNATIYRSADGSWVLEQGDEAAALLANAQVFEVMGRVWRFCCSELSQGTLAASSCHDAIAPREIGTVSLAFAVSRDEEYVRVKATCEDREIDLGSHAYHYLLLTLARRRLADAAAGLPETSCGWVDLDELARDPTMAPPRLNIDVYRIRTQLGKLSFINAADIIERRPSARQLRIGTRHLSIEVL
jgi:hypothetical protein